MGNTGAFVREGGRGIKNRWGIGALIGGGKEGVLKRGVGNRGVGGCGRKGILRRGWDYRGVFRRSRRGIITRWRKNEERTNNLTSCIILAGYILFPSNPPPPPRGFMTNLLLEKIDFSMFVLA